MIIGQPLPERPANLDAALARGYDPHAPTFDHVTPEELSDEWQAALDGSLEWARHLREDVCHVPDCGWRRCGTCDERITCTGPELARLTCAAHDDECVDCNGENPCRDCAATRRAA